MINQQYESINWPSLEEWKDILPYKFVINFESELIKEEITQYKLWYFKLSSKKIIKEIRKQDGWSL